ncbi:hypothetical protein BDV18DRAFT_133478 [Aspergillus unguis]
MVGGAPCISFREPSLPDPRGEEMVSGGQFKLHRPSDSKPSASWIWRSRSNSMEVLVDLAFGSFEKNSFLPAGDLHPTTTTCLEQYWLATRQKTREFDHGRFSSIVSQSVKGYGQLISWGGRPAPSAGISWKTDSLVRGWVTKDALISLSL